MNDTTHLDYLESYVPGAIQLAGHGPDWRHHHRIGRDVAVPDALLDALCPGLTLLMETFSARLHLFKHLMLLLIQVSGCKELHCNDLDVHLHGTCKQH